MIRYFTPPHRQLPLIMCASDYDTLAKFGKFSRKPPFPDRKESASHAPVKSGFVNRPMTAAIASYRQMVDAPQSLKTRCPTGVTVLCSADGVGNPASFRCRLQNVPPAPL